MSDKMGNTPTAAAVALQTGIVSRSDSVADNGATLSGDQATQGIKLGHMRYVLGAGLVLAIAAGVSVVTFFAH